MGIQGLSGLGRERCYEGKYTFSTDFSNLQEIEPKPSRFLFGLAFSFSSAVGNLIVITCV